MRDVKITVLETIEKLKIREWRFQNESEKN